MTIHEALVGFSKLLDEATVTGPHRPFLDPEELLYLKAALISKSTDGGRIQIRHVPLSESRLAYGPEVKRLLDTI